MSDDATPRLSLPYLAAAQAQKHVTLNEALGLLDGLVQTAVESRTLAAEPANPADGALHILPQGRTGPEWSLHPAGALVRFESGGWIRLAAGPGCLAWIKDEGVLVALGPAGWTPLGSLLGAVQNLQRLGLGAAADATNPLSVRLNKALFAARPAAEGGDGDLRFTLNKETPGDVLSLLFQTGFAARAEIGLVGDDDLVLRVSPDGEGFQAALTIDRATGAVALGPVIASGARLSVNGDLVCGTGGDGSGLKVRATDGEGQLRCLDVTDAGRPNSINFGAVGGGGDLRAHGTEHLFVDNVGGELMRLTAAGRLGVGVSGPSSRLQVDGAVRVKAFAKAGLPSAATEGEGAVLFVTDEIDGATLAFSDGAVWRRTADRVPVS